VRTKVQRGRIKESKQKKKSGNPFRNMLLSAPVKTFEVPFSFREGEFIT
jgi:hypothetical protein